MINAQPMFDVLALANKKEREGNYLARMEIGDTPGFKNNSINRILMKSSQEPHRYSWWSQRFPSVRLNNKGWRIDYINVTDSLKNSILDAEIFPEVKHSDHCPVYLELKK